MINSCHFSPPPFFLLLAEHEKKRKEQCEKLYHRTKEQIEEEEYLLNELKRYIQFEAGVSSVPLILSNAYF